MQNLTIAMHSLLNRPGYIRWANVHISGEFAVSNSLLPTSIQRARSDRRFFGVTWETAVISSFCLFFALESELELLRLSSFCSSCSESRSGQGPVATGGAT